MANAAARVGLALGISNSIAYAAALTPTSHDPTRKSSTYGEPNLAVDSRRRYHQELAIFEDAHELLVWLAGR